MTALLLLVALQGGACVCAEEPAGTPLEASVAKKLARSGAVFEAVVTRIESGGAARSTTTYARVRRLWKGDAAGQVAIEQIAGDCEFPFVAGRTYVVYAERSGADFTTNLCSGNVEATLDSAEVRALGNARAPSGGLFSSAGVWIAAAVATAALLVWLMARKG